MDAIEALGNASLAEFKAWGLAHYPHDPLGTTRADPELFTVNSPSRIHYIYSRSNWRSDQAHPHDRLFKLANPSPPRGTR